MDKNNRNDIYFNKNNKNQQFSQADFTKTKFNFEGKDPSYNNLYHNTMVTRDSYATSKNLNIIPILCCGIVAVSIIFLSISLLIINASKKDVETTTSNAVEVVTEISTLTDAEHIDTSSENDFSQPYFPQVSGYMDIDGLYVKKGKEYKYNDGANVCYLPDILVESDYSNFVETDIQKTLYSMFSEEIETKGLPFPVLYDTYCVGDVISLVVVFVSDDYNDMKVYNFHRETGAEVTNSDLLAMLGISEEIFYDRSISLQKQKIAYNFKNIDEETKELYENKESYIKYSSESHMKEAFLYVDELGYLHILNKLAIPSYLAGNWCDIIYT